MVPVASNLAGERCPHPLTLSSLCEKNPSAVSMDRFIAVGAQTSAGPEGATQFCGLSQLLDALLFLWFLTLSWLCGWAQKKGLLGTRPLGRLSPRKQHTPLFVVFPFPPHQIRFVSPMTEVKETKTGV